MSRLPRPIAALLAAAAVLPVHAAAQAVAGGGGLRTRPEISGFRETSRYADVMRFMETADRGSPLIHLTTFGYTFEGRALPLAVVGRVRDASPAAVRAAGKTVVYLQANIHAGEVEGKEALQNLLREVVQGRHGGWLDSLVLLVAPIFNADGNERVALTNRPLQHGPVAGMGTRNNAQNLNINRDHTKLDTPEARAQAWVLREYDPHVLLDLHTTNGTYHAYHLTYAPPLHPNTDLLVGGASRDLVAWVAQVAERDQDLLFFDYGNVPDPESRWAAAPGAERGWYTFDHRPRFSSNYWGLRNRFGILSETYSYLPFRERIQVQQRFVEDVLEYARAHAGRIRRLAAQADAYDLPGEMLAVRVRLRRTGPAAVRMGAVEEERNPYTGEPMLRRRDVVRPETMPLFIGFEAAERERVPIAWLVPAALGDAADRLRAHGVRIEPLARDTTLGVEEFRIDSTAQAAQPSEGHRERTLHGAYHVVQRTIPAGTLRVQGNQPLGRLAFTLLEPRSDDGFAAWGLLDEALEGAAAYPILRIPAPARLPGPHHIVRPGG